MLMHTQNKPIDKVRKLLAMAEGGTSAEQNIALRKAQKLMAQHDISASDLVLDNVREVHVRISNSHKPKQYATLLTSCVEQAFGARGWLQMTTSKVYKPVTNAVLVGFEPHIEVAEYVLHYLVHKLNQDMQAYKTRIVTNRRHRRKPALKSKTIKSRLDSFAIGWVNQVAAKLRPITQSPVQPDEAGKAIIPVDVLDEYIKKQGITGKYRAKSVTLNEHTYQGEQAGRNVSVRAGVARGGESVIKRLHS